VKLETTRRGFFGTAAGLAGFAATAGRLAAEINNETLGFKLGIASYSFRKFPRAEAIKMILEIGTPYVSIKEFHLPYKDSPEELEKGRKEFEAAGIKIMSGGNISLSKNDDADIKKYFEYAKTCGMPMIVCAPTHENLKKLEAAAKEYNIKAAIHNHGPEDKHFPSPESVLEAVKGLDPRVGLCMDVGHSERAGSDPVKIVSMAGPRLLDMHVKDLRSLTDKGSQCDVGDGKIPFPALFKTLQKVGYKGCVNLEYEINADKPMPGMQRSFSYMRGVMAGIKG
jgi:sugar phosphate isomerase/epimerase